MKDLINQMVQSRYEGQHMRMKVICGDLECREEFFVDSKDAVWECPSCSREIANKNYPFLTAKLIQAKIEGDSADWKVRLSDLIEEARKEISERSNGKEVDLKFLDDADSNLKKELDNNEWKRLHDELLDRAKSIVRELEG